MTVAAMLARLGHRRTITPLVAAIFLLAGFAAPAAAQVTGRFAMSFFACTSGSCEPTQDTIYLAQSNDGVNWSLVPNYPTQTGSVPTPIRRGNTLYIYYVNPIGTTVSVQKYHYATQTWDSPVQISLSDSQGYGSLVDPSAIVDAQGNINLVYLSAVANGNYDPAGCPTGQQTCVQHFRLAVENSGSDGAAFTAVASDLVSVDLGGANQPTDASDPAIFATDGQFYLYINEATVSGESVNEVVMLYSSSSLTGSYTLSSALPGGLLVPNPAAGIASGFFDNQLRQYWTYQHMPPPGEPGPLTVIGRAATASLSQQIQQNQFTEVASGSGFGLGSNTSVQHPHMVALVPIPPQAHDYNGDGYSDILWTDGSGDIAIWEMNGTTILNPSGTGVGNISTVWSVAETGDFNGDGYSDILWRDTSGDVVIWEMNGTTIGSGTGLGTISTTFTVQGTNAD
ncbi:MAG TPA: FG-GAP-like repeat-containing protein [Xanthobacteraceae bacterium]|nr:FG-GAP-like repeat-containing protein [Xanthobacteraceae bacterium]